MKFDFQAWTTRYIRWVVGHPRLVLGLLAAAMLPCMLACATLRVNNTITTWFLETDPNLASYYAYQKVFGNDEVVVIATRDPVSVFTPDNLLLIRRVANRIEAQKHVQRVLSVATATAIEGGDGTLSVHPVLDETAPIDAAAAAEVRRLILEDPLWKGNILSDDGRTTLILVQMKTVDDIDAARAEALIEMRLVLDEEFAKAGKSFAVGGIGVIYDALNQLTVTEGGLLIGLSYLIIIASMMLILRQWRYALLGLVVVWVTVTLTMGVYRLAGNSLNMVTVILPSLLLVLTIADFVHVVIHFHNAGPVPEDRDERAGAVTARVGHIAVPCFYTSLTSSTGFLALATSPISLVRELGLYGGLGCFLEWFVTMTFCALALRHFDPVKDFRPNAPEGWMQRLLVGITRRVLAHPVLVGLSVVALTAFCLFGMMHLVVDTYTMGYFSDSHPVKRDHEFIEKNFGYYIPVELTVTATQPRALQDPAMMAKLQEVVAALTAEPVVSKAISILDFSRRVHQVMAGGKPEAYRLPGSRAEARQELMLYEMDPDSSLDQYMTRDYQYGRVSGRMKMMSVRPGKELMERLEGRLQAIFGADAKVDFAGYLPLYVKIIDYLVQSQIQSFALAMVFVFGPMWLLFRSVRLTVISIVPNVLPIGLVLGAMGWLGIPLDVATVTIAAIVLGIAVDDTIHFLHGFQEHRAAGGTTRTSIEAVVLDAGKAVVTTTFMLFFGFGVMGVSSVKPIAYFGLLSGGSLLAGLVCEFLVTPVLLKAFHPDARDS